MAARRRQQQRGVWSHSKLRLLATVLGYPRDLLVDCIPPDMIKKHGMNSEDLQRSLDSGHFTAALNVTWNMKNYEYNVAVIKKCVQFLDSGIISFNELRIIRLTFFTFEQPYKNGLIIDKDILMKVLKICSRVVAPEKLMHRIKHWKNTYTVKDRIQFYEFMDLLLLSTTTGAVEKNNDEEKKEQMELFAHQLTESVDKVIIKEDEVQATEKTSSDLLQLEEINSLGESHYEKLTKYLSKQFYQEERNYGTITIDSKRLTKQPLLVEKRKQAAQLQRNVYQWLKTTLKESHEQVNLGKGRDLILPLPPLEDCHKITRSSKQTQLKFGSYTAHSLPPIISTEELEELQEKKMELTFQMNTVEERADLKLKWKIDYYLPGYRELLASRQDAAVGLLMKTKTEVRPKESEMASIPVKRNDFVPQASKRQPGNSEKLPHASIQGRQMSFIENTSNRKTPNTSRTECQRRRKDC